MSLSSSLSDNLLSLSSLSDNLLFSSDLELFLFKDSLSLLLSSFELKFSSLKIGKSGILLQTGIDVEAPKSGGVRSKSKYLYFLISISLMLISLGSKDSFINSFKMLPSFKHSKRDVERSWVNLSSNLQKSKSPNNCA